MKKKILELVSIIDRITIRDEFCQIQKRKEYVMTSLLKLGTPNLSHGAAIGAIVLPGLGAPISEDSVSQSDAVSGFLAAL